MRISMISGAASRRSGGLFNSVRQLSLILRKSHKLDISCLMYQDKYSSEDLKAYKGLNVLLYRVVGTERLAFSPNLWSLLVSVKPNLVHIHCLWLFSSVVNLVHFRRTGVKYIVSPRGMLDAWQFQQGIYKNMMKKLAWYLYEYRHLKNATCLHALCSAEYYSIRQRGLKCPVAIIPNGVSVNFNSFEELLEAKWVNRNFDRKSVLFLSRLHPKKGLLQLLEGWSRFVKLDNSWVLRVCGISEDMNYAKELHDFCEKLEISESVVFVGGVFGDEKHRELLNSDAFILPSFSEGLPMAVLEAWSYGLPVLMTQACNLSIGFEHQAAFEISADSDGVFEGLVKLKNLSDEQRIELGHNGFNLVEKYFSWDVVCRDMILLYNWSISGGSVPSFIKFD